MYFVLATYVLHRDYNDGYTSTTRCFKSYVLCCWSRSRWRFHDEARPGALEVACFLFEISAGALVFEGGCSDGGYPLECFLRMPLLYRLLMSF